MAKTEMNLNYETLVTLTQIKKSQQQKVRKCIKSTIMFSLLLIMYVLRPK